MRMGSQPVVAGFPENPWPGQRRNHDIKSILRLSAIGSRIGEWTDDLQLLNNRTGPAVRDDDGQRIGILRPNVNEVDVYSIDRCHELRQRLQLRLALAPVVIRRPIACEFLHRRQLHTLRCICDRFLVRPTCGRDAFAHVGDRFFRKVDVEGTD